MFFGSKLGYLPNFCTKFDPLNDFFKRRALFPFKSYVLRNHSCFFQLLMLVVPKNNLGDQGVKFCTAVWTLKTASLVKCVELYFLFTQNPVKFYQKRFLSSRPVVFNKVQKESFCFQKFRSK